MPRDTSDTGRRLRELTAPGGEFELVQEHGLRVYRRGPHTLREMLLATAAFGDRAFSIYEGERRSYAEHLRLARGLAAAFRDGYGLVPGDRVAIAMRNYPEYSPVFWATQLACLVAVPLNAWWSGQELVWAVGDAEVGLIVADGERTAALAGSTDVPIIRVRGTGATTAREWDDLLAALDPDAGDPDVDVTPDTTSTILYTSGTTGRPKGAVHSHRNHITNALNVAVTGRAVAMATGSAPVENPGTLISYPLFHIAGLNGLYGAVLTGARVATMYRWDVEQARALFRDERLTNAAGVPTTMRELVEAAIAHPSEMSTLTRFGMGGAPIPAELVERIGTGLAGRAWPANGYGSTETTSAICANSGPDYVAHPDSVGRPAPGADLRVVDPESLTDVPEGEVGELWFRGPNIFQGYWRNPDATAAALADGWFRTGDLGRVRDGWVYVVDRLKDVVLRGGENVYSAQVEDALQQVPWVVEAAVYGLPHPTLGEEVAAAVRVAPGAPRDEDELRRVVTERVAGFAVPTSVVWFDGPLPRTATGKVLKRELRNLDGGSLNGGR